ncbi:hypothetical protein B566_EDAN001026 [Ephemera danica]|nr:hypothetical protein B566_EDAN001026 [Ephemera danica]
MTHIQRESILFAAVIKGACQEAAGHNKSGGNGRYSSSRVVSMKVISTIVAVCVLLAAARAEQETGDDAISSVYRFLQGCGEKSLTYCIKMRALSFVDGALHQGDLPITDGVTLVQTGDAPAQTATGRALSEDELESSLPRESEAREAQVDALLVDRVARFLGSHTLQLKVPDAAISDVKRSLEEGRKKKKKLLLPLLLALKLKAAALIPLVLGAIALLALKALVVGKLALVLSALIGLQKLLGGQQSKTVEVVAHPTYSHEGEHHGHYGRALDSQDMAYSAHAPAAH